MNKCNQFEIKCLAERKKINKNSSRKRKEKCTHDVIISCELIVLVLNSLKCEIPDYVEFKNLNK